MNVNIIEILIKSILQTMQFKISNPPSTALPRSGASRYFEGRQEYA